MPQLKPDEWPGDGEPTTTEREVPTGTRKSHEEAVEQAHRVLEDRLDEHPPVPRHSPDE